MTAPATPATISVEAGLWEGTHPRALLLAVAARCSVIAAAHAQEAVKIGWLSSLAGPLSSAAIAENQGVVFAVAEINKAGGILGHPGSAIMGSKSDSSP